MGSVSQQMHHMSTNEAIIKSAREYIQILARYLSADLRKVQEQMKDSIEEFQDEKGKLLMEEARRLREDMDDLNDEMQKCFDENSNCLYTSMQLNEKSAKPTEAEENRGSRKRQRDKPSDGEVIESAPRKMQRKEWTMGEDVLLIAAMHQYDEKKDILWRMLSKCVPGRTSRQCYNRWHQVLNPELKHGPWSDKEDALLFDLQKKHGSYWIKISSLIPGRSSKYVCSRWNSKEFQRKYCGKPREEEGAPMKQRKKWSKGEDVLLITAVHRCGNKKNIPQRIFDQCVPGRTSQQCYDRWHQVLNPELKRGPWSDEEDALLFDLQKKHGNAWIKISSLIPGRANKYVCSRWNSKEFQRKYCGKPREEEGAPMKQRKKWSKGEDVLLITAVHRCGNKKNIPQRIFDQCVPGRTSRQCYNRWHHVLDPELKHGPWSDKEDALLFDLQKKHGSYWIKISSLIPGRSSKHVCNRWNSKEFQRKYLT